MDDPQQTDRALAARLAGAALGFRTARTEYLELLGNPTITRTPDGRAALFQAKQSYCVASQEFCAALLALSDFRRQKNISPPMSEPTVI